MTRSYLLWAVGVVLLGAAGGASFYFWTRPPAPLAPAMILVAPATCQQLAFYPDGSRLVGGLGPANLVVWDVATGQEVSAIKPKDPAEEGAQVCYERAQARRKRKRTLEQSARVFAAGLRGWLPTLAPACLTGEALERAGLMPAPIRGVDVITALSGDGVFSIVETPKEPRIIGFTVGEYSFAEPGDFGSAAEPNQVVTRFRVAGYKVQGDDSTQGESYWTYEGRMIAAAGFSADGRWLLLGKAEGSFYLIENKVDADGLHSKLVLLNIENPEAKIKARAILPGGKKAIMDSAAEAVGLWDLHKGRQIYEFPGLQAPLASFALSKDGRRLLTASSSGRVTLWDVEDGHEIQHFQTHPGMIRRLLFSPDGSHFLSDGADDTLRLWDVEHGKELARLAYPKDGSTALAFSPDGRTVVAASGKEIHVWDLRGVQY